MKQKEYMKAVLERLDENNETTCQDCHKKDMITHAIIDHDTNTVKVVCHECFTTKYQGFLYNDAEGDIN
jgi:hypothetical protein